MRRRAGGAGLALLLTALAACADGGPEGPGAVDARIEGPAPLGAAVIEVPAAGVTAIEGAPGTHVIVREMAGGALRAVLIGETPGDLAFRIQVEERSAAAPLASVLSASDALDRPVTAPQAFQVRFVR